MSQLLKNPSSKPVHRVFFVPKNKFRVLDNELEKLPEYSIPLGKRILHPFYTKPNPVECTALCINERNPQLFEGKPVLPALVKDATATGLTLIEARLDFHSVKNIRKWLHNFVSSRQNRGLNILTSLLPEIRRSGFTKESSVVVEVESLLHENPSLDAQQLDAIISRLLIFPLESNPIFMEELFLYILQREELTEKQWLASLTILPKYLGSEIDDKSSAIEIISQWLFSSIHFNLSESTTSLLIKTIKETCQKFQEDITDHFSDEYLNMLLGIYVKSGKLHESSELISKLISRDLAPSVDLVEAYMELVKSYPIQKDADPLSERKFKMANLYELHSFFKIQLSPKITEHLLGYCVHHSEIFALFDLVTSSPYRNNILDIHLKNFLTTLSKMDDSHVKTSLHLFNLYAKLKTSYEGNMPHKYALHLINSLASASNFRAIQQIIHDQNLKDYNSILHLVENQNAFKETFGFTASDKSNLIAYLSQIKAE